MIDRNIEFLENSLKESEERYAILADQFNQIVDHLLGPDWYSLYWNSEDIRREAIQYIMRSYKGVKENKINKWKRKHKRCAFCNNLKFLSSMCGRSHYVCEVKDKIIKVPQMRRVCKLFELNNKF